MAAQSPVVMRATGLVKRYGQVTALDGIDWRAIDRDFKQAGRTGLQQVFGAGVHASPFNGRP